MSLKGIGRPLSENEIQNSILEFLRFKKITAWRNNSGGVYDPSGKRFRSKSKWDRNGVSDILGILPDGKFLAIEVKKNEQARTRPSQREFLDDINNQGGRGFVAYDLAHVKDNLKEYI